MFWRNRKAEELAALRAEMQVLQKMRSRRSCSALRRSSDGRRLRFRSQSPPCPRGDQVNGYSPGVT